MHNEKNITLHTKEGNQLFLNSNTSGNIYLGKDGGSGDDGAAVQHMVLAGELKKILEDLIDEIIAGVRSSFTYAGAKSINEFHQKAVIGIQSAAGYAEGRPLFTS